MPRYKPPKIEDIGLEKYLDGSMADHGGFNYFAFHRLVENGVNTANIARAFKVDRRTVDKWIAIYKKGVDKYK